MGSKTQPFVLQNIEEAFSSYTALSALESGRNVISAWHCQHDAAKGAAKLLLGVALIQKFVLIHYLHIFQALVLVHQISASIL